MFLKNHFCIRILNQSERRRSMTMEILRGWRRIDFAWHANDSCDKLAWRLLTHAGTDDSTSSWWLCYSNRSSGRNDCGKSLLNVKTLFWLLPRKSYSSYLVAQNVQSSRRSRINVWKFDFSCLQLFSYFSFVLICYHFLSCFLLDDFTFGNSSAFRKLIITN